MTRNVSKSTMKMGEMGSIKMLVIIKQATHCQSQDDSYLQSRLREPQISDTNTAPHHSAPASLRGKRKNAPCK
jgi:hypothetical protein